MISVPVLEQSQVADARRLGVELANRAGFDGTVRGRVALVITEMATNLVKHGCGGNILAQLRDAPATAGQPVAVEIELIAIDRGHGIADLGHAMQDGFSTAGSAGHGLGAIRRQSDDMRIYSRPNGGTAIAVLISNSPLRPKIDPIRKGMVGAVSVTMPGQDVCGDGWQVEPRLGEGSGGARTLMVADGLGHGPFAAEATAEAKRIFGRHAGKGPAAIMELLHGGLRATRGAAISIARFDEGRRIVEFCGIGNVAGYLASRRSSLGRRLLCLNGTVGHTVRKIQQVDYPYPDEGSPIVILHSDGISTQWSLADYPGLVSASPSLIAAVLYRDFGRSRDDATVLVSHASDEVL